jgi:hypothetical protein
LRKVHFAAHAKELWVRSEGIAQRQVSTRLDGDGLRRESIQFFGDNFGVIAGIDEG